MNRLTPDTEPITATHCRRCGHPVIQAVTEGLKTTCDPTILTITDQIRAHLDNRPTYELLTYLSGYLEFVYRTASRIVHHPNAPVVAIHRCPPSAPQLTWRQQLQLPPAVPLTTRTTTTPEDACPPF